MVLSPGVWSLSSIFLHTLITLCSSVWDTVIFTLVLQLWKADPSCVRSLYLWGTSFLLGSGYLHMWIVTWLQEGFSWFLTPVTHWWDLPNSWLCSIKNNVFHYRSLAEIWLSIGQLIYVDCLVEVWGGCSLFQKFITDVHIVITAKPFWTIFPHHFGSPISGQNHHFFFFTNLI